MMRMRNMSKGQRGATLVEFAIGALVFFTATFGVLEFSRLLWTHNALNDAARVQEGRQARGDRLLLQAADERERLRQVSVKRARPGRRW